jgi:hypothetical protein
MCVQTETEASEVFTWGAGEYYSSRFFNFAFNLQADRKPEKIARVRWLQELASSELVRSKLSYVHDFKLLD